MCSFAYWRFLICFLFCFETGSYSGLAWNSLCKPSWPQNHSDAPASAPAHPQSVGIKGLYYHMLPCAEDGIQVLELASQTLHPWALSQITSYSWQNIFPRWISHLSYKECNSCCSWADVLRNSNLLLHELIWGNGRRSNHLILSWETTESPNWEFIRWQN